MTRPNLRTLTARAQTAMDTLGVTWTRCAFIQAPDSDRTTISLHIDDDRATAGRLMRWLIDDSTRTHVEHAVNGFTILESDRRGTTCWELYYAAEAGNGVAA